ncbi:hypothetical protein C8F01DRAFT_667685 [Mycena amicta]|nr:hypothetical protein C8F01DRAFT_667685 [Mycena amicta]
MHLGQFSVSVLVNGAPLSEYGLDYSPDGQSASCWIPSVDGQAFCVESIDHTPAPNILVYSKVALDGLSCGAKRLKRAGNVAKSQRDSMSASEYTRRPLLFGKQAVTDNDTYLDVAVSPDYGSISVLFMEVLANGRQSGFKLQEFKPQLLHERSKKGLGHSVQLGEEFGSHRNKRGHYIPLRDVATFTFRYRPVEVLRAQGIAPRAVGAPTRKKNDPEDILDLTLDDSDDEELKVKRERTEHDALRNRDSNRAPSDVKPKLKVKKERVNRQRKGGGGIIDLT